MDFFLVQILTSGLSDLFNNELNSAKLVPDATDLFAGESNKGQGGKAKAVAGKTNLGPGKMVKDQSTSKTLNLKANLQVRL